MNIESLWDDIVSQTQHSIAQEPLLRKLYQNQIIEHKSLSCAISHILASKLFDVYMPLHELEQLINNLNLFISPW